MIGLIRFFLRCFLFTLGVVLAIGVAYDLSIKTDTFPKPPPAWVKFIGDTKDASQNLEKTAGDLNERRQL